MKSFVARQSRRSWWFSLPLLALSALASPASAATRLVPVVSDLSAPVYVTHAGDGRLFIVEQAGRIRIFNPSLGALLPTPFLDLTSLVSYGGEQGLLSMAFHPDYASNGFFFVNYTNLAGDTVIARYRVSSDANVATPASGVTLLLIAQPFDNHNGGQLQIGPDGYMYIGMGDGGSAGDPNCNAQSKSSLLGKMLRVDVRANLNTPPYYGIPADNPFRSNNDPLGEIRDEVYAFGLRNPWRFSFDRLNGDLFIADVGQDQWEEVDLKRRAEAGGQNFGWRVMEGAHCYQSCTGAPACGSSALRLPIHEYNHGTGGCSITGGYVSRSTRAPELSGRYVFGDYCSGRIEALRESSPGVFTSQFVVQAPNVVISFGEGFDGRLYVIADNDVFEIQSDGPSVPAGSLRERTALALALLLLGAWLARARFTRAIRA
jgi:glucose/arabinose dehydrogenase